MNSSDSLSRSPHRCAWLRSPCAPAGGYVRLLLLVSAALLPSAMLRAQTTQVEPIADVVRDVDGDRIPDRVGDTVAVHGVATSGPIRLGRHAWALTIQDSSAGVYLFTRDSATVAGYAPGDRVRARGELGHYQGTQQIQLASVRHLASGLAPEPRPVLAADLHDERYAGQLVSLSGELRIVPREGQIPAVELVDRSGPIRVSIGTALLDEPDFLQRLLEGGHAEVVGIAGQRKDTPPFDSGYRVYPRTAGDVNLIPAPPYAAIARGAVVVALLLALAYVAFRRRGAERRAKEMAALTRELRRSEEALRASESRLRMFISQAPAVLWSTDRELRFTFARGQGLPAIGAREDRMVGLSLAEYFGTDDPAFPPVAAHRRALAGEPSDYEAEWAGRTFQCRVEPFHSPEGEIAGTIGIAFDVTERVGAEASLRRSERYFRALTENAADIITVLEADGTVRYQSPSIAQLLGYTPEQLVGTNAFLGAHRDDRPSLVELFREVAAEPGAVRGCVFRNRHSNGGWRCLDVTMTNLLHDPAVEGLVVNSRDITDRRDAEEALRLQTAYNEQLFEGAPEGIVLLDVDDRVLRANAEFTRMFGLSGESIEGRAVNSLIVPPDRQGEALGYTRRAAGGERISVETIRVRSDGTPVHVSILAAPVRVNGKTIALFGIYRDITERKTAEEALLRREKQLADAQQLAHVGSWEFDIATGETVWSDELWRIFGLRPGAFPPSYERFLELVAEDDREKLRQRVEEGYAGGDTFAMESRVVRPDRSVRAVVLRAEIVWDEDGTPVRLIGTTQDVTEWKHLEEQFRQAQKMEAVGRLAGGIAHDFNNLLTGIKGYADLLLMDLPESSPFREPVEEIDRAATRAAGLTGQLLAYSRKQVMLPRVLDLNAIVESSGAMLRRLVGERIDFRTSLAPDLGPVRADPVQLEQVLMNLVVNARDAMPDGGTLTIETHEEEVSAADARGHAGQEPGRFVVLSVRDTGHGMDAGTLSQIFEPFFTTKGIGKGTGLGLSTAYGIVRQSGGDIRVRSAPGSGSVFEVRLPRSAGVPRAETAHGVRAPAAKPAKKDSGATILLVEDEQGVRDLVRRILERIGHTPLSANTGAEALRLVQEHPGEIDLMVSDVVLPGMSGPVLAERIWSTRPEMRVIFMSGYTDEAIEGLERLNGGPVFLQKPFSPQDLAEAVRGLLERAA